MNGATASSGLASLIALYVAAAPLPCGVALLLSLKALLALLHAPILPAWLMAVLSLVCACGASLAVLDSLSRHAEYRRALALLRRYGFQPRIFRTMSRSRCQRDAALLAARHAGCPDLARDYYRSQGYRWFHLLPDGLLRDPRLLLDPRFLRSSFVPPGGNRRGSN